LQLVLIQMRLSSLCLFVSFESRHIYDQTANVLYNYGYGYVQWTNVRRAGVHYVTASANSCEKKK